MARKLFNKIFINAVASDSFKFIHSLYTQTLSFSFKANLLCQSDLNQKKEKKKEKKKSIEDEKAH